VPLVDVFNRIVFLDAGMLFNTMLQNIQQGVHVGSTREVKSGSDVSPMTFDFHISVKTLFI